MLIFLSGAGRTGKTSTVEEFLKLNPEYYFVPSVARSTMNSFGIQSEADFYKKKLHERIEVNLVICSNWIASLEEAVKNHSNIIFDRSLYDSIGYLEYITRNMNRDTYILVWEKVSDKINEFKSVLGDNKSVFFHLTYPCWWHLSEDPDPFRTFIPEKEITVDRTIELYLRDKNPIKLPDYLSPSSRAQIINIHVKDLNSVK